MPISDILKTQVDGELDKLLVHFDTRQEAYFVLNDRYFQGIKTPATKPADGATKVTDSALKPTDQDESWADAGFVLPNELPMSMAVHTYDGPQGKGYAIVLEVIEQNTTFSRIVATGLDGPRRTHNWQRVIEESDNGIN